ncbi:MAG: hypothetical protein K8S27_07475 [Candidatus Omnitrophica bacterium]|nr:hypothetical protein [Candidatus Omnitrophota bacterium]
MLKFYSKEMKPRERRETKKKAEHMGAVYRSLMSIRNIVLACIPLTVPIGWLIGLYRSSDEGWFFYSFLALTFCVVAYMLGPIIKKQRAQVVNLRQAIDADLVHVIQCQATQMMELDEKQGEGVLYGFQVEENKMFFLRGKDYYPNKKFPSIDFEIINSAPINQDPILIRIEAHGRRLYPETRINESVKKDYYQPKNFEILEANMDSIRETLRNKPKIEAIQKERSEREGQSFAEQSQ